MLEGVAVESSYPTDVIPILSLWHHGPEFSSSPLQQQAFATKQHPADGDVQLQIVFTGRLTPTCWEFLQGPTWLSV